MTVLVTGASGFVGAALVAALLARGDDVLAVDRSTAPHPDLPACRFRTLDVTQPGALDDVLSGERIDRLVIGAAITADAARERRDPAGVIAVNVGSVAETIRAAACHRVRRMLYLGSGAVYGDSAFGPGPLLEDATALRPKSLYAITKAAGEATALRLAETFGLDLTVIRLGTCFGPFECDSGARDTPSAPYQMLRLAEAGTDARLPRAARRDWLYVRDAVAGTLALLDAPSLPHRVYNVAAGFEWSLTGWCREIAARRPDFRCSVTGPETANVNLYDAHDRAAMSIDRITADTAYRPAYDRSAAAADLLGPVPST